MSACIRSDGEFSEHVPDGVYTCIRCGETELGILTAELMRLRSAVKAVRAATTIADETDVTAWQRGYRACAQLVAGALAGVSVS